VPVTENLLNQVRQLLGDVLGLGPRATDLTAETALLGSLPELDSMAVATVLTAMEDRFGMAIDDSLISADIFETLGSLSAFVQSHMPESHLPESHLPDRSHAA
jgi:acyl carrier protein